MTERWLVSITHSVVIETEEQLTPNTNNADWEELRNHAMLKMWTQGYDTVKNEAEVACLNLSEFDELRKDYL
jgi:hypothetical protein